MTSSTLRAVRELLAPRAAEPDRLLEEGRLHLEVAAGHDVVEHRHALEQRDVLERARDALRGRVVRVHAAARRAAERDRALLRVVDAVDDVQHRALARAVRADDRADLVLAHVEADVGQRLHAAERERDVRRAAGRRRRCGWRVTSRPSRSRRSRARRRANGLRVLDAQVGATMPVRPSSNFTCVSMCCDAAARRTARRSAPRTSRRRSRAAPCACASARRRRDRAPCAGSGSGGPASRRARARAASSALTCSTHSRISSYTSGFAARSV